MNVFDLRDSVIDALNKNKQRKGSIFRSAVEIQGKPIVRVVVNEDPDDRPEYDVEFTLTVD